MRVERWSGVLLAVLVLTACGGDEPGAATLPAVSAVPSAEASVAAPTPVPVPTEAQAETPEGAVEFARFFYAEVATGFQTQSPELVSAISLPSCATCQRYVTSISEVKDNDWTVRGGDFVINFAEAPQAQEAGTATVDVGWDFEPATYFDASGEPIHDAPAVRGAEETLRLERRGSSWSVAEIIGVRAGS